MDTHPDTLARLSRLQRTAMYTAFPHLTHVVLYKCTAPDKWPIAQLREGIITLQALLRLWRAHAPAVACSWWVPCSVACLLQAWVSCPRPLEAEGP